MRRIIVREDSFDPLKQLSFEQMAKADLIGYWFAGRLIVLKNRYGNKDAMTPEQLAEWVKQDG